MSAIWHRGLALPVICAAAAFVCGIATAFTDNAGFGISGFLWLVASALYLSSSPDRARAS